MPITLNFIFGKIEVFPNYVIAVMKEGVTVKPEYNAELIAISNKYFENRPFAYITHRLNSYSVDPRTYIETSKIENLVAFAVVSNKTINISNSELEKIFLKKPFDHFDNLEEAIDWVTEVVANVSA
ncbi:hypothetical protein ATE92_2436 [Ulvibacter sp. MAR_2010_11]|uniref:hypothetical protein n=1 Tax=Ulvibacter sp. MAR_2010_11 TaxID=1250229 RepID=UPI000C2C747E|nr:hypothetical protein [Ulvibacter sp. MAR_2010_11]PKA84256.1 hypothetical protein ATE92_2436 [Ulvibacter sp. MAR_2010_11]